MCLCQSISTSGGPVGRREVVRRRHDSIFSNDEIAQWIIAETAPRVADVSLELSFPSIRVDDTDSRIREKVPANISEVVPQDENIPTTVRTAL